MIHSQALQAFYDDIEVLIKQRYDLTGHGLGIGQSIPATMIARCLGIPITQRETRAIAHIMRKYKVKSSRISGGVLYYIKRL